MDSNFLTTIFLPLALFIIMLGMGLGLTIKDFQLIFFEPKAVLVGLTAQLILVPVVGFVLAMLFPLSPELAVGVAVLAACPGGPTSNMVTYLVKGHLALSITLTALSSLITVFTIPLVVNFAMLQLMGNGVSLQLPLLKTMIQIAVITLIPVGLGMLIHQYMPKIATQLEKQVKWLSLFFLGLIIVGVLLKERANVLTFFLQVGGVTLTLNILTMLLGYGLSLLSGLNTASAKAITVEVGIQNGTLAIALASAPTFLNTPTMAIPAAIYSLLMFVTSVGFVCLMRRR
jgi:BASS family bile acid:Na+ symporter